MAKKSEVLLDTIAMVDEAGSSDGALLAAVSDAWVEPMEKDTVLFALKSAPSVVEGLPIRVPDPDDAHLQKKPTAALEKLRTPRSTRAVLQKRLSSGLGFSASWLLTTCANEWRGLESRSNCGPLLFRSCELPPEESARGSRFQKHDTRCRFGCDAGPDSVQHFLVCEAVGAACLVWTA